MTTADYRFFLRLNADEFPYVAHPAWLVSGQAYRGRYETDARPETSSPRRRVRIFHPDGGERSVVLFVDQLEPEISGW